MSRRPVNPVPPATSQGSNRNGDSTSVLPPLEEQVTFLENILGISYAALKASKITVKQQGSPEAATTKISVRATQGASVDYQVQFSAALRSSSLAGTADVAAPTPTTDQANRAASTPEVPTVEDAVPEATTIQNPQSPPLSRVPVKRKDKSTVTPKQAKKPRGAARFKTASSKSVSANTASTDTAPAPSTPVARTAQTTGTDPAPRASSTQFTALARKKPLYQTECLFELYGHCNRFQCNLLHDDDQEEYFFSGQQVEDGRPWAKEAPHIVNDFKSDLPKARINPSDWAKRFKK
ncbi:hypothetical protein E8E11_006317 [Didymella keratinophila]|nr:hypothetical protein E8E11_006317 [Didymella keratinophila]